MNLTDIMLFGKAIIGGDGGGHTPKPNVLCTMDIVDGMCEQEQEKQTLVVGENYTVIANGDTYTATAFDATDTMGGVCIGNLALAGGAFANTGESFLVCDMHEEGVWILVAIAPDGQLTISIPDSNSGGESPFAYKVFATPKQYGETFSFDGEMNLKKAFDYVPINWSTGLPCGLFAHMVGMQPTAIIVRDTDGTIGGEPDMGVWAIMTTDGEMLLYAFPDEVAPMMELSEGGIFVNADKFNDGAMWCFVAIETA